MRKRYGLALILFGIMVSTGVNAEQVKFPLPDTRPSCNDAQMNEILSTGSREIVFEKSHPLFSKFYVYDVEMKCTLVAFPSCPPYSDYKDRLRSTQKGDLLNSIIKSRKGDPCVYWMIPELSESSSDYQDWKAAKTKEDAAKMKADKERKEAAEIERQSNKIVYMSFPEYVDEDSFITISFDKDKLLLGNKSTAYVLIKSVSTYLNNDIYTISNLDKELPPESISKNPIYISELFSPEMSKSFQFPYKQKQIISTGKTKFGFAIKYFADGVEKRYYSTKQYQNIDLMLGM